MTDAHALADLPTPPDEIDRPALAQWLFRRDISLRSAARTLGWSHEAVRRWCLPFSDPHRKEPDDETKRRIDNWTRGEVSPDSFTPPGSEPRS